ncbi:MAG: hypothetical protein ABI665_07350 [Vicinamibacterales bacterium]
MQPHISASPGFTLLETIIATSVLVTVLAGVAQLLILGTRLASSSGRHAHAVMSAQAKIEDLRARRFGYDAEGDPVTDPVLTPSPAGSLYADAGGYSEALDDGAEVIPAGDERQRTFTRRWAVAPLDRLSPEVLAIEVCVFREPATGAPLAAAEACVATIRTRQP